jgi:hypothetical protein
MSVLDRLVVALVGLWVARRHGWLIDQTLERSGRIGRRSTPAVPRCADDKFIWRKIFDRDPRFTIISDKIEVKDWVAKLGLDPALGLEILPPRWIGTDAALMPEHLWSDSAILKANHGSGTNVVLPVPERRRQAMTARANGFLTRDYGAATMQWGYFGVPRRLFVEDRVGGALGPHDLKLHVFGGRVLQILHTVDRFGTVGGRLWEADGSGGFVASDVKPVATAYRTDLPLPSTAERAIRIAACIGAEFDQMRVDLISAGHRLWLGELTIYHLSGLYPRVGHDPDHPLARAWDLRRSWFLRTRQRRLPHRIYAAALRRVLDREDGAKPLPTIEAATTASG